MNFETAWIHFLSDVFSLLSSRNFTTMVGDEATSPSPIMYYLKNEQEYYYQV